MKQAVTLILTLSFVLSAHAEKIKFYEKEFRNVEHGIAALIPDGWEQVQGTVFPTILRLKRKDKKEEQVAWIYIRFVAHASIDDQDWNEDFEKKVSDDPHHGDSITTMTGHHYRSSGKKSISGHRAFWYLISNDDAGRDRPYPVLHLVYCIVAGSSAFNIGMVAHRDWFYSNEKVFSQFLRNVRFSDTIKKTRKPILLLSHLAKESGSFHSCQEAPIFAEDAYRYTRKAYDNNSFYDAIQLAAKAKKAALGAGIAARYCGCHDALDQFWLVYEQAQLAVETTDFDVLRTCVNKALAAARDGLSFVGNCKR